MRGRRFAEKRVDGGKRRFHEKRVDGEGRYPEKRVDGGKRDAPPKDKIVTLPSAPIGGRRERERERERRGVILRQESQSIQM